MLNGSWTKLKVTGRWGARIEGVAQIGDAVRLVRKDGKAADKVVAAVVWQGNGVTLAEVADAPPAAPPAPDEVAMDAAAFAAAEEEFRQAFWAEAADWLDGGDEVSYIRSYGHD